MDWSVFLLPWSLIYLGVWIAVLWLPAKLRNRLAWFPVIAALVVLGLQTSADPGQRLLAGSFLLLLMVKGTVLLSSPSLSVKCWLLPYMTVWPGMELCSFDERKVPSEDDVDDFSKGWALMLFGLVAFGLLAIYSGGLQPWLLGALAVAVLIITIHFGASHVLTCGMRLLRYPVTKLFDKPTESTRLSEFWSRRWNIPFVDMNRILLMPFATRTLGRRAWLIAFLVSGLLHELAISYPAGSGYGLPLAYFALQVAFIAVERKLKIRSRAWVFLAVLLPAPLLFHAPFLTQVVAPLVASAGDVLNSALAAISPESYIVAIGVLTLLPLIASLQVPAQLRWREELGRLSSLNAKLMWVYGGFIVGMILAQGVFLITFPRQIVNGSQVALAVVGFCALFWCARLIIDTFVFKPSDWPSGAVLNVGRTMLNTLFVLLALCYTGIIVIAVV